MLLKREYDLSQHSLVIKTLLECPYLPSPLAVIDAALDIADFHKGEVFADLGCGDGTVLIRAAQKFEVLSVGFEIDRNLIEIAKRNVKAAGFANLIDVVHADLFTVDFSRLNVIYIYLSPLIRERLSEKIMSECSNGARILVHDYPLPPLHLDKIAHVPCGEFHTHTIYLYKL